MAVGAILGQRGIQSVNGVQSDTTGNVDLSVGNMTTGINMNSKTLTGLTTPVDNTDAVTKQYADTSIQNASPYNWLDNGDFRNPVNQRGKNRYTSGYTIDRWKIETRGGINVVLGKGYVSVTKTVPGTRNMLQILDNIDGLLGKTITFALKYVGNATIVLGYYVDGSIQYAGTTKHGDLLIGTLTVPENTASLTFYITAQDTNEIKLYWAAVYEGTYTADTLPDFQAKGYGAEMSACRRYYQEYRGIYCDVIQGQIREVPFWYGQPMRIVPTVTVQAKAYVNGQWIDDPSASPTPTATACRIYISANSATYKIDMTLSADL